MQRIANGGATQKQNFLGSGRSEPTPAEIAKLTAEIRSKWTPKEQYERRVVKAELNRRVRQVNSVAPLRGNPLCMMVGWAK